MKQTSAPQAFIPAMATGERKLSDESPAFAVEESLTPPDATYQLLNEDGAEGRSAIPTDHWGINE